MTEQDAIPKVVDNDRDEISVTRDGGEMRVWSYHSEQQRREKIGKAREFVEGWCEGYRMANREWLERGKK